MGGGDEKRESTKNSNGCLWVDGEMSESEEEAGDEADDDMLE